MLVWGLGGVGVEALGIEDVEFVHAIGEDVLLHLARDAVTGSDSLKLYAQFVGQLAALGEEFKTNFLNRMLVYFAVNKNVIHCIGYDC